MMRIIGELCGLFWSAFGLRIESLDVRRLAEHLRIQWADHRPDLSEDTTDKGKGWEQYGLISRPPRQKRASGGAIHWSSRYEALPVLKSIKRNVEYE